VWNQKEKEKSEGEGIPTLDLSKKTAGRPPWTKRLDGKKKVEMKRVGTVTPPAEGRFRKGDVSLFQPEVEGGKRRRSKFAPANETRKGKKEEFCPTTPPPLLLLE